MRRSLTVAPVARPGNLSHSFSFGKYMLATTPLVNYDVSPDGQQFVFVQPSGAAQAPLTINVVLNFPAEIRAMVQK